MKCATERGSGATMYILSFIKIGPGKQKSIVGRGEHIQTIDSKVIS
jgi:hypothetical protein